MPIITNGGEPLGDCPTTYTDADTWLSIANRQLLTENGTDSLKNIPHWGWDYGFKLDFDGPMLSVSSRFYPPKTHYGPDWDGSITVILLGKVILEENLRCTTLDELRKAVVEFTTAIASKVENILLNGKEHNNGQI